MDYRRHYNALIERAKRRDLDGYCERHHIIPRCLGGGNEPENFVRLTAEEHYVAHQLLVKMHPGNHKLVWALSAMSSASGKQQRLNNKRYAWVRRLFAETMRARYKGKPLSPEHRAKLSQAAKNRVRSPHGEEAKRRMSIAAKDRPKSDQHRAALSAAKIGTKQPPRSAEWLKNQTDGIRRSIANRDESYKQDPEYRARQAAKMRAIWAERRVAKLKG